MRIVVVVRKQAEVSWKRHQLLNRLRQFPLLQNMLRSHWAGQLSRYSEWLRAGRSGDRIRVGARFSALVQTGHEFHPASCTMGTGYFLGVKRPGRDADPYLLLLPWSRKGRAIPLLPLRAVWPVQSISACATVHFTLPYFTFTEPRNSLAIGARMSTWRLKLVQRWVLRYCWLYSVYEDFTVGMCGRLSGK